MTALDAVVARAASGQPLQWVELTSGTRSGIIGGRGQSAGGGGAVQLAGPGWSEEARLRALEERKLKHVEQGAREHLVAKIKVTAGRHPKGNTKTELLMAANLTGLGHHAEAQTSLRRAMASAHGPAISEISRHIGSSQALGRSESGSMTDEEINLRDAARAGQKVIDERSITPSPGPGLASTKIPAGQYHVRSGNRMGKAHMVVEEGGHGTYVNSRGERKPLTMAQVKKNHDAGMNHLNTLEHNPAADQEAYLREPVTEADRARVAAESADLRNRMRAGDPATLRAQKQAVEKQVRSQAEMERYFQPPWGKTPAPLNPAKLTDAHLHEAFQTLSSRYQSYIWQPPDRFKQGVANRMEKLMTKLRTEAGTRGLELGSGAGPPPSAVFR